MVGDILFQAAEQFLFIIGLQVDPARYQRARYRVDMAINEARNGMITTRPIAIVVR